MEETRRLAYDENREMMFRYVTKFDESCYFSVPLRLYPKDRFREVKALQFSRRDVISRDFGALLSGHSKAAPKLYSNETNDIYNRVELIAPLNVAGTSVAGGLPRGVLASRRLSAGVPVRLHRVYRISTGRFPDKRTRDFSTASISRDARFAP